MTLTQLQHYEVARRRLADADIAFMEMVAHPTNPYQPPSRRMYGATFIPLVQPSANGASCELHPA